MTEHKNTPQEIDLIELFGNIWNGIVKLFLNILYFFLRNALYFILAGVIGLIFGYGAFKLTKPFYKSELFGYSYTINNVEAIQYINNWNFEETFSDDQLESIKSISAQYVLDLNGDGVWDVVEDKSNEYVTDTAIINKRMYGTFCISTELYDTSLIDDIRDEVFLYLESNKRVQEMNQIRLAQKQALIPILGKEIHDLDSLKNLKYFESTKNKNGKAGDLMILNEKETKLFHDDIINLYKQQQRIERELFLTPDPFEITQDFTIPRYQENSMVVLVLKYIQYALAIGFIVILLLDRRKFFSELFDKAK